MSKSMIYLVSVALVLGLGLTGGVAGASEIKINFQAAGAPIPDGYLPDYGELFGDRGNGWSYGWSQDMTSRTRDRNNAAAPDQRHDTLVHFQPLGGVWEIELPNGTYNLFIVCGDPSYADTINNIVLEGERRFDILLARCRPGIAWTGDTPDVHAVFVLAGTRDERNFHLRALAAIAQVAQPLHFYKRWIEARNREALRDVVLLGKRPRL